MTVVGYYSETRALLYMAGRMQGEIKSELLKVEMCEKGY